MKILFVSPEVEPLAKTGGLADVAGSLPKAFSKLGHDIAIVMPGYKKVLEGNFSRQIVIPELYIPLGSEFIGAQIQKTTLPSSKIPVYLVCYDPFFSRDELYQEKGKDFPDNPQRFNLFAKAVLEMLPLLKWKPDIIHTNDWQTALVALYLKTKYEDEPFYKDIASIYTIHNMAYQGVFPKEDFNILGLESSFFSPEKLEFWGQVNFAKAGIIYADFVTTVSERYSLEIQTPEFGCGLDGLLRTRREYLFGIINGIDYQVWNPESDPAIPQNYNPSDLSGKRLCKLSLQKANNLPRNDNIPILGIISRLADQKGFDLLNKILPELLKENLQLIILGTGDPKYHEMLQRLKKNYPDKIGLNLRFDALLAQMIYAGSSIFLMPSHYEPCGLGQMISLKYGTIPIVRQTGGLADTIVDFTENEEEGNGFVFNDYTPEALSDAISRALKIYNHQKKWTALVKKGMANDFSWERSAKKYLSLYEKAVQLKKEDLQL